MICLVKNTRTPTEAAAGSSSRIACTAAPVRLRSSAKTAAQQRRHHPERDPIVERPTRLRREGGERDQRGAGLALHESVQIDEKVTELGEDPHRDRERTGAQPERKRGERDRKQSYQQRRHEQCGVDLESGVRQPNRGIRAEPEEELLPDRDQSAIAGQRVPHRGQQNVDEQRGHPVGEIRAEIERTEREHDRDPGQAGRRGDRDGAPAAHRDRRGAHVGFLRRASSSRRGSRPAAATRTASTARKTRCPPIRNPCGLICEPRF